MKTVITIILSICFISIIKAQTKIEISDFEILNNTNWKGTLMYLNYSDGKEVTLQTTMSIILKKNKIITEIKFPREPKANSTTKIKIRKNGTYFGDEKIISKEILNDKTVKIITFYDGNDNGKKARMYKTYIFSTSTFSITKEVQYLNSNKKFIRNQQNYIRM
ncbi:hypothetical protein [Polaribacter aestuariivivens]|uniref:hypothetical protein n=1 Tax=Polaribacter aestuariivivens TaxID=2304626 RepID=UPI003F495B9B